MAVFVKKNKKKIYMGFMILIIFVQVLVMIWFGSQKEGFHIDETFTYNLSNSYKQPFTSLLPNYMKTWHTSSFWNDSLTVQPSERFAYDAVIRNQTMDVHPPLYYILFHTISSLFPDVFSMWFGLGLNIVFFALSLLVLYFITKGFIGDTLWALLPSLLYGFSIGAVNTILFIRMYAMHTFFCLIFVYFHQLLWKNLKGTIGRKYVYLLFYVFSTTLLGFLTHYYFLVFAFFLSAAYCFYLLFKKQLKKLLFYCITMFSSLLTGYLLFPSSLAHLLKSNRGIEAFDNLLSTNFFAKIKSLIDIVNREHFNGMIKVFFALLFAVFFAYTIIRLIALKKGDVSTFLPQKSIFFFILVFVFVAYFVTIAKVAPYVSTARYIFNLYPLLYLLIFLFLFFILSSCQKYVKSLLLAAFLAPFILFDIQYYPTHQWVTDLYIGYGDKINFVRTEQPTTPAIYLTERNTAYASNTLLLREFAQSYNTDEKSLTDTIDILNNTMENSFFISISRHFSDSPEEIIQKIIEATPFSSYELFIQNADTIYFIRK